MGGAAPDHILLAGSLFELADEVALGTHFAGAPGSDVGIPHGKAVVMLGHRAHVARTGFLEELHPVGGVEFIRLEERDEVFVTELVGRAVVLGVPFNVGGVHPLWVPLVFVGGDGVKAPVDEDADLGLVEPAGHLIEVAEAGPGRGNWAGQVGFGFGVGIGRAGWSSGLRQHGFRQQRLQRRSGCGQSGGLQQVATPDGKTMVPRHGVSFLMCPWQQITATMGKLLIDPAIKYCQGAPSISAFFAEMGGNTMSLFSCRINSAVLLLWQKGFLLPRPCRKNKYAARVGRPDVIGADLPKQSALRSGRARPLLYP